MIAAQSLFHLSPPKSKSQRSVPFHNLPLALTRAKLPLQTSVVKEEVGRLDGLFVRDT